MTRDLSPCAVAVWVLVGFVVGSALAAWLPTLIGWVLAVGDLLGVTARPS